MLAVKWSLCSALPEDSKSLFGFIVFNELIVVESSANG